MKVGVVIVTYNSAGYLPRLFESLKNQTYQPALITVVDNNSQDQSVDLATAEGQIQVIKNKKNIGFGAATNIGTKDLLRKGCTHILWLNPDTFLESDSLEKLTQGLQKYHCDLAQPAIHLFDQKTINTLGNELTYFGVSYCPHYNQKDLKIHDQQIYFPSGACLLISKKALETVGLLDEKYFLYLEDTDFAWRTLQQNFQTYLIADAKCYHDYTLKLGGRKMYWLESNRLLFLAQNYSFKTLLLLFPVLLFLEVGLLIHSFIKLYFPWKIAAYFRFLIKLPTIFYNKKISRKKIALKDKDIFPFLAPEFRLKQIQSWPVRCLVNPCLRAYYRFIQQLI